MTSATDPSLGFAALKSLLDGLHGVFEMSGLHVASSAGRNGKGIEVTRVAGLYT